MMNTICDTYLNIKYKALQFIRYRNIKPQYQETQNEHTKTYTHIEA